MYLLKMSINNCPNCKFKLKNYYSTNTFKELVCSNYNNEFCGGAKTFFKIRRKTNIVEKLKITVKLNSNLYRLQSINSYDGIIIYRFVSPFYGHKIGLEFVFYLRNSLFQATDEALNNLLNRINLYFTLM